MIEWKLYELFLNMGKEFHLSQSTSGLFSSNMGIAISATEVVMGVK